MTIAWPGNGVQEPWHRKMCGFAWKQQMVRRPKNTALTMEELRFAVCNHTAGTTRLRVAGTGLPPKSWVLTSNATLWWLNGWNAASAGDDCFRRVSVKNRTIGQLQKTTSIGALPELRFSNQSRKSVNLS